jgi:hypothetical protein
MQNDQKTNQNYPIDMEGQALAEKQSDPVIKQNGDSKNFSIIC